MTALASQAPSPDPLNIRWGHSALEVLSLGEEFSRCRHLETGRELDILTDYLRQGPQGTYCLDSTDYLLPVTAGERLAVVRRTSRGALAKKDGVTGWYLGPLGRRVREKTKNSAPSLDFAVPACYNFRAALNGS